MKVLYIPSGWMPKEELEKRPSHNSYYATSFAKHIKVSFCTVRRKGNSLTDKIRINLHCLLKALRTPHDLLYVPSNVEVVSLLIVLRSLRIYPKPVIRWKYTPCHLTGNILKDKILRFYYKGFDKVFFLSEAHARQSVKSGILKDSQASLLEYGVDIQWYDTFRKELFDPQPVFISTGRENRDFKTLIEALKITGNSLTIYTTRQHGENEYYSYLDAIRRKEKNIRVLFSNELGMKPDSVLRIINEQVAHSFAVLICCKAVNYGVGFTNLLEALPLGKPVIITENKDMPIDVEKEGIGLKVKPYDIHGWVNAVNYLLSHPEEAKKMGQRARALAEERFNGELVKSRIEKEMESLLGHE